MMKVYLGLGGNVSKVSETFDTAAIEIENLIGRILNKSSRYRTEPWGNKNQDYFLNQVLCVETNLNAENVLKEILAIEKKLGRDRNKDNQFAPRTIDIDILFYGEKIINNNSLSVPHPRLHMRNFVLTPLMEIAPDLIHPLFNKKIKDLVKDNPDDSLVKKETSPQRTTVGTFKRRDT